MKTTTTPLIQADLQAAMIRHPLIVSPETPVLEAIARMSELQATEVEPGSADQRVPDHHCKARPSCVLVADGTQLLGILTEADVVYLSSQSQPLASLVMREVMSSPVISLRESACTDRAAVIRLLQQKRIRHLPLLDEHDRIVGLLNLTDMLAQHVAQLEAENSRLLENYTTELEQQIEQRTVVIQAQANREQLMFRIALWIRQTLQVEEILQLTVTEVRQLLAVERVLIYQFQLDMSGTIVAEAVLPGWSVALGSQINDTCFQQSAGGDYRSGQKRAIADIYQAGLTPCHLQLLEQFEVKANLVAPIIVQGNLWGLLVAHQCTAPRQWQAAELDLLDQLVVQIAIALQQATAYQQAQAELAERQRVEAILRASKQRYATLTKIAPVGIVQTDAVGHCCYVNQRWCDITGLSPAQALKRNWFDGIHPDDQSRVSTAWEAAVQANRPFRLAYRLQDAAGQVTWVFGQVVAEQAATGELVGYIGTLTDMSDLKQAEAEQLRKRDAHLRTAQRISQLGSWEFDPYTQQIIWSDEVFRIFGRDPEAGPPSFEQLQHQLHPDDRDSHQQTVQTALETLQPYEVEYRLYRPDGTLRYIQARGEPVINSKGQIVQLVGTILDITVKKQAEQELIRSRDLHEAIFNESADALFLVDPHSLLIVDCNRRAVELFGAADKAELLGIEGHTLQRHQFSEQELADIVSEMQTRGFWLREVEYVTRQGDFFWGSIATKLIVIAGHTLNLVRVTDISARKQAEEQLRDLSDRLSVALKSGAIAIWDWDILANVLTWDDRMYELYGIAPEHFTQVYTAWLDRLHPDDRPRAQAAIQQALAGEQDYDCEFRVIQPDGTVRFIKAYGLVQRNAHSEPQHMIGINFDISDRKQVELNLLQTTAQLAASNQELEAFAYSVSHDLRSPLRAIDGFSKALLEDYGNQLDAEGQDYFNRIRHNVSRMGMLIDDLLCLSRVSRSEMQYSPVNLSALVQEQVHELQALEPDRQVRVKIEPAITVIADLTLMRVVISNLLQNAWKFTSHRPIASIEFGVIQLDEQPTYFVRDDGAGFDMAYANLLFGVFQRLHNTDEFPGTGIGLATVQRVIHRHGGRVWAKAAVDQGATFYFTVPNTPITIGTK